MDQSVFAIAANVGFEPIATIQTHVGVLLNCSNFHLILVQLDPTRKKHMSLHRTGLPQTKGRLFLTYTGMETDLLFTQGVDLPGFATYPFLETEEGRYHLRRYFKDLIEIAKNVDAGVMLESPTWVANRDRGAAIGYASETLKERNVQAVESMVEARDTYGDLPTIISANVGPRADSLCALRADVCR